MKKKGSSNIEFILAFVLFAGFIGAILYFFDPVKDVKSMDISKDYVINEIARISSIDMNVYSVVLTGNDKKGATIDFPNIPSASNVRVLDYYGNEMPSEKRGNSICFDIKHDESFSTVYIAEDIDEGTAACGCYDEYQIASSISQKVISEKRILRLNSSYYEDYSSLKREMNVPEGTDFSFRLEFNDGNKIVAEGKEPLGEEVFSQTKSVEVLRKGGAPQYGYLTVRVW